MPSERYPKYIVHDNGVSQYVLVREFSGPRYRGYSNYDQQELVTLANRGLEMLAEKEAESEKQRRRVARARKKLANAE